VEQDRLSTTNHIDGPVHVPTVQAGAIYGGVHLHGVAARPAQAVAPPKDWEDLPELAAEVRFLLRAQIQAAQELPYRLPGARRPSLATVYVRQDLGTASEESTFDQPRPTPILDGRGQLTDPPSMPVVRLAVRPPSRMVREALDGDNHVLVTGGPGQGKSTLSLRLAADIATKWTSTAAGAPPLAEPVVPLRLTARELASRPGLSFPAAVAQSVQAEYGASLDVFGDRVAGCRWLLLVDGLDEVADSAERDRLVAILAMWASDDESPYRVVLTTRPLEGAALAPLQRIGAARYELQPFNEEALRHFADNWFESADRGFRFVRQIRAAHLDELVRVPLLATIAAIIFEQHDNRPLPDNQYELYESYLKYLRSQHSIAPSPFDQACTPLLEHLGRVRLEADTSLVAAANTWAEQHFPSLVGDWQEDLTAYLTSVGPLVRRGDDLRFLHHSFAEHLAATAKARLLPDQFDPGHPDFARLLHSAHPEEPGRYARAVLLHYTRLHAAEADGLIEWLHAGGGVEHLLAARLLAWHVPATVDVVEVFIATVRAWAMTTEYPGQLILEQASRATLHPGTAGWLAELMRDENAPWASRVEAATALSARLRGAQSPDAIAHLRMVVSDESIPVAHRLAAAEALSDCGGQREASERGLRSILTDPLASALNCRNAALVLASFGGSAREHAVENLIALLDDPWTPDADRVQVATGLLEIGVEFHDRCAKIFRAVLKNRTKSNVGVGEAATGLASLGAGQRAEAVSALTRFVTDRRLANVDRTTAAEALAKLGPVHRGAAGGLLLAMSAEFNKTPGELRRIAASLTQVGLHEQASGLLRAVLSDRTAPSDTRYWAARTLAKLGPEHQRAAARAFQRLAGSPAAEAVDRAAALGQLANLGEPYRTQAVASMRVSVADRSGDPTFRCWIAEQLAGLGPEYHGEAAEHLLEITSCRSNPEIRLYGWRGLRNMGAELRSRAAAALLALAGPDEAGAWESYGIFWAPVRSDVDGHDSLIAALTALLNDPSRNTYSRVSAAETLCYLGKQARHAGVTGVIGLLRSGAVPATMLRWIAGNFDNVASGQRAELADAMRAVGCSPDAAPKAVCDLAQAMERLGFPADPGITTALRGIVADDSVDSDARSAAAVALARAVPDAMADAVAIVLDVGDRSSRPWDDHVRELAVLGGDVVPGLRSVLSSRDVHHDVRQAAAVMLAELRTDLRGEAVAGLRALATDEFLGVSSRTCSALHLVDFDPATRDDTIAYHQAVLNDERQSVRDRCEAAYQLTQLDNSFMDMAFAALRRFAADPEFRAEERASGVAWFRKLSPNRAPEVNKLGVAVANDGAATVSARQTVRNQLSGEALMETRLSLLTDSAVWVSTRVEGLSAWRRPRLATRVEAVLREVIGAPDSSARERVAAAAALADFSPKHLPEAVRLLEKLSTQWGAAKAARAKLADLSPAWRRRLLAEAEHIVADEQCPWRQRYQAATRICGLTSNPSEPVIEYLRRLTEDRRVAANVRLEIHCLLRRFDGLDQLRVIRDDEKASPAIRWTVASRLKDFDVADRAAGARTLRAIAVDTKCRPALRRRAAHDLMDFGERGRELAVPLLQAIATDETLPVLVRVDAARALILNRPDLRGELLRFLRQFRNTVKPLARVQVFEVIGVVDTGEGTSELLGMASDRTLASGVRRRAGSVATDLRRDCRERAAIVAREIAHDETVPIHIRVKAARELAWWSEICRQEARALLVELNAQWTAQANPMASDATTGAMYISGNGTCA
jgi:cellulose synthase operon protein C